MKKLAFLLVLPLLWQCTTGPSKSDLQQMNDSLLMISIQKDVQLNQFIETMGDIEENIRLIKEKEQIISLKAESGDYKGASGKEINDDIQLIYEMMVQNKDHIKELEKKMKTAGADNSRLNRLIAGLNDQLRNKTEEIVKLQEMLLAKDVQIDQMSSEIIGLNIEMDSIKRTSDATRSMLDQTTDKANAAWYAIGTRRELRDQNIVTRDGFLFFGSTQVLKDDFDKKYFKQIDIRKTDTIPLYTTKADVLTSHPAGSYEIVKGEDDNMILVITDAQQFWSIVRYLVVRVN